MNPIFLDEPENYLSLTEMQPWRINEIFDTVSKYSLQSKPFVCHPLMLLDGPVLL